MKHKRPALRILLAASLILYGLTAPLAIAADVQKAGYNLTIDVSGLPNGTFYNLVATDGATYSGNVEVISGPDLVIPNAAGTVNLTFQEMIDTNMGTYERFSPGSSPFPVTVNSDTTYTAIYASGSITGSVFNDYNGNYVRDSGEPGIPNATVELLGTEHLVRKTEEISAEQIPGGLTTFFTGITDGDGQYRFDNLPAGTFYVRATLPGGGVQESGAITLTAAGGLVSSGQADFAQEVSLPYTGR